MTGAKLRPTSKTAWAKSNDAGPHLAVLPSGAVANRAYPMPAPAARRQARRSCTRRP